VVGWTDREAHLDSRLATLVAHRAHPQASRLAGLLVAQILALRHRWQPQTLVRRRVPRSVYLFAGSLAALVATAFLERQPAPPIPHVLGVRNDGPGGSPQPMDGGTLLSPSKKVEPAGRRFTMTPSDDDDTDASGAERGAITNNETPGGHGPSKARPDRAGGAAPRTAGDTGGGSAQTGTKPGQAGDATKRPADPLTNRLQNLIRDALGAKALESGGSMAERHTRRDSPQERQPLAMNPPTGKPEAVPNGPAPNQGGKRAGAEKPLPTTGQKEGTLQGAGPAAGASGERGQGAEGPLAGRPASAGASAQPKRFQLNLTSLAFGLRSLMEPQQPAQEPPAEAPTKQAPSDAQLSEYDRAEDPVVRPAIAPEYEPIVRRLFSHED
jgi:hypothetical protein